MTNNLGVEIEVVGAVEGKGECSLETAIAKKGTNVFGYEQQTAGFKVAEV